MSDFFACPTFTLEIGNDMYAAEIGFWGYIKESTITKITNFRIYRVNKNGKQIVPDKKEMEAMISKINNQIKNNFGYIISVIYKELMELVMLQTLNPKKIKHLDS